MKTVEWVGFAGKGWEAHDIGSGGSSPPPPPCVVYKHGGIHMHIPREKLGLERRAVHGLELQKETEAGLTI